jgi:hypothetical protein
MKVKRRERHLMIIAVPPSPLSRLRRDKSFAAVAATALTSRV